MTFEEMAKARYSVKRFNGEPVADEKLQKILQVAGVAPTARNKQSVRIYVLKSEEALKKAKTLTPCRYNAPVMLIFSYEDSEVYHYPEEEDKESGAEDCSIVATHVMFEALEQGIGTCWVNNFTPEAVRKAFALPESEHVVLMMDIGYPAEGFQPLPNHVNKKPLEDIVRIL